MTQTTEMLKRIAEHVGPYAFALASYKILGLPHDGLETYYKDGVLLGRFFREGRTGHGGEGDVHRM